MLYKDNGCAVILAKWTSEIIAQGESSKQQDACNFLLSHTYFGCCSFLNCTKEKREACLG